MVAALLAGYIPKIIPIASEKMMDTPTTVVFRQKDTPPTTLTINRIIQEKIIPITHPTRLMVSASTRN